jgi:hypothetical protein
MTDDYDDETPFAQWEAALLPDWTWEAYEKEEQGRYYGRVKSPLTYGNWEWGTFTEEQLRTAGAYRTDTDGDDAELYPDGGHEIATDDLISDGGSVGQYLWLDPDTGAALYHTTVFDDEADPFFESAETTERFLERQHELQPEDEDRYERMSLYKIRLPKEKDAIDVLLDQSGLDEFAPDGGDHPETKLYETELDAPFDEEVETESTR